MSETVRTLIRDAFLRSTVRGLGETPDEHETDDALHMLNEILDVISGKEDFSTGMENYVLDVPERGFVTFSDNPHRVFSATISNDDMYAGHVVAHFLCKDSHGLSEGDGISIRVAGRDFDTEVHSVVSHLEFTILVSLSFPEGKFIGSFKLQYEPDEFKIDFITTPPVNIFQVVGSGEGVLPECQQQLFYAKDGGGKWWYYNKGNTPYPRLYVNGCRRIKVVFQKPFIRRVTLDTDLSSVDPSALSAIKYRLAAEIAGTNGYDAKEESLMRKYKHAYATFVRSKAESASPDPDTSMAGYGRNGYDIYTDGAPNASF